MSVKIPLGSIAIGSTGPGSVGVIPVTGRRRDQMNQSEVRARLCKDVMSLKTNDPVLQKLVEVAQYLLDEKGAMN